MLKKHYLFIGILFLAVTARVAVLFRYGNFWGDELFSVTYSQKPWLDSITKYWLWETNPPLHMIILKLWFYLFPVTEFWARVPSVIAGVATILVVYRLAQKLTSAKAALISALLVALSSTHIFFSITARAYSLLLLLTALSYYYFFMIFFENNSRKYVKIIFALAILLLLYTHLTALLILTAQAVTLFILKRQRMHALIRLIALPIAGFLFWAVPAAMYKISSSLGAGWFFNLRLQVKSFISAISSLFFGHLPWPIMIIALALVSISAIRYIRHNHNATTNQTLVLLSVPLLLPVSAAIALRLYNIKFFLVALPFAVILCATFIASMRKLVPIAFTILVLFGVYRLYISLPISDWQMVNRYLEQRASNPQNQVFLYSDFTQMHEVGRYVRTPLVRHPYMPVPELDWDYYLITQNYWRYRHPEAEISQWLRNIYVNDYSEIFLLDNGDAGVDVKVVLRRQGWQEIEQPVSMRLVGNVTMRHFLKAPASHVIYDDRPSP